MKETTCYSQIESVFRNNGGYITRKDIDNAGIPSWFLYDFVRKNKLIKIAPGYYANESYFADDYYILQKRYPKYVFSGMSALYIHHLTDKIPMEVEVTSPQGYHPSRKKIHGLSIHRISNKEIYNLGITEVTTFFGNKVRVYDEERTICDLIKNRDKYDGETFIKAIKFYIRKTNNEIKLRKYAKIMGISKKVFEIMEILNNDD